jgi:excisionase family DNA binding protein
MMPAVECNYDARGPVFRKKSPQGLSESQTAIAFLSVKREAAALLSISPRALDYLLANKQIAVRRIGSRVLVPMTELQKFSRADHPAPLAG